jgi:S-adenosylmethionine hydrolase
MAAATILFLSDLGVRDESVGVCHAVMRRIAPDAPIVDLGHGVAPMDIRAGALTLAQALPYLPTDGVVLAVVDPGSGTDRLAIAVRTASGRHMVGPDNGLLSLAWALDGGVAAAVAITSADVILQPPSPVLNARDVFAPAAAHLAAGGDLAGLGSAVGPERLISIRLAEPEISPRRIAAEALDIDRFGNVRLNVRPAQLGDAGFGPDEVLEVASTGSGARVRRITTYGEVREGETGILADAWGWLSIIRFGASAAELLGVRIGDPIWLAPAD